MGLSEKKLFIFDLDGVIYRDADPIESGIACVQKLQTLGSAVAFFTNNSTKSPQSYAEKLATMGLEISSEQVFTSSIIAASFLKLLYSNGSVFVIGEMGLISAMKDVGFEILNEKFPNLDEEKLVPSDIMADFVIVGLDQGVTYNKFRMAMMLIMNGAPFFATNDDANIPVPGALWPGAGANVAFLSTACGKPPEKIFGKPHVEGIQSILEYFQMQPQDAVFIGDRLDTDIVLGNQAGLISICVGTGVSSREEAENAEGLKKPMYFFETLDELFDENIF